MFSKLVRPHMFAQQMFAKCSRPQMFTNKCRPKRFGQLVREQCSPNGAHLSCSPTQVANNVLLDSSPNNYLPADECSPELFVQHVRPKGSPTHLLPTQESARTCFRIALSHVTYCIALGEHRATGCYIRLANLAVSNMECAKTRKRTRNAHWSVERIL